MTTGALMRGARWCVRPGHRDHHVSLLVSGFHVLVGTHDLLERESTVDDWQQLACLDEVLEQVEVARLELRGVTNRFALPASGENRPGARRRELSYRVEHNVVDSPARGDVLLRVVDDV